MKIDWKPSEQLKKRAIKVSLLKENGLRYQDLQKIFGHGQPYLVELKKYGDELRKKEINKYFKEKGESEETANDPIRELLYHLKAVKNELKKRR